MSSKEVGVLPPPAGVTANFANPPNQMGNNIALYTVLLSAVTGGLILRLYTRMSILRSYPSLDDYFCIVSWCLSIIFTGLMFRSYHGGIGRHIWDVPVTWLIPTLKFYTIAEFFYLIMTATIKLTFLTFYYRVFAHVRTMRYLIVGGMAFVAVSHFVILFCTIFSCIPVRRHWNQELPGKCWNNLILPYASGVLSCVTDIFVLVLPIDSLWKLNMKTGSRLKLMAVFGLGAFCCIASLIRLGMTHILDQSTDTTWNISHLSIWAVLECNVGIFCSSLMLLPKFLETRFPHGVMSGFTRLWRSRSGANDSLECTPISKYNSSGNLHQWSDGYSKPQNSVAETKLSTSQRATRDFV